MDDNFFNKMLNDCYYNGNLLEPIFKPFFEWLAGETKQIKANKQDIYEMLDMCSDRMEDLYTKHPNAYDDIPAYNNGDPLQMNDGFKEDKYLYSYYAYIEGQLSNMLMMC